MSASHQKPGHGPGAGLYMPLSAASLTHGVVGPSHCVFSSPKVTYSEKTQKVVNLLAQESKLTHAQRNLFQAILRSGNSLPERWEDAVARRREYNRRRVVHGRELGLDLRSQYTPGFDNRPGPGNYRSSSANHMYLPGSRRTYESIKASGDLDTPTFVARNYVPKNSEQEKARLAYKMAFGKNPDPQNPNMNLNSTNMTQSPNSIRRHQQRHSQQAQQREMNEKPISQLKKERFNELIEEIQERVEFIQSMRQLGRDKSYHTYITCQIKEKLGEMRRICGSSSEIEEVVRRLQLDRLDESFMDQPAVMT